MGLRRINVSETVYHRLKARSDLRGFQEHEVLQDGTVQIILKSELLDRLDRVPGATYDEKLNLILNQTH